MSSSSKLWSDLSFSTQLNPLFSMASSCTLWSDLPQELLELIFENLTDFFSLLRCRTICQSWRSAAKKVIHNNLKTSLLLLPLKRTISQEYGKLLLPSTSNKSPSTTKVYTIHSPKSLARTSCQSSNHGWLLMADIEDPCMVYLYNPISTVHLQLPLLPERDYPNPLKLIMSNSPDDHDCSVLVLYGYRGSNNGCVCKPGDNKWRKIIINMGVYEDMIYYHGELYATDRDGTLLRLKYGVGDCIEEEEEEVVLAPAIYGSRLSRYLAESPSGELVTVVRRLDESWKTTSVRVYKLICGEGVWEEINDFGDHAILLTHNNSVFVPAGPGMMYKSNCIYFVDDLWVGDWNSHGHDYGIYELKNQKIDQLCEFQQIVNTASLYRWINLH